MSFFNIIQNVENRASDLTSGVVIGINVNPPITNTPLFERTNPKSGLAAAHRLSYWKAGVILPEFPIKPLADHEGIVLELALVSGAKVEIFFPRLVVEQFGEAAFLLGLGTYCEFMRALCLHYAHQGPAPALTEVSPAAYYIGVAFGDEVFLNSWVRLSARDEILVDTDDVVKAMRLLLLFCSQRLRSEGRLICPIGHLILDRRRRHPVVYSIPGVKCTVPKNMRLDDWRLGKTTFNFRVHSTSRSLRDEKAVSYLCSANIDEKLKRLLLRLMGIPAKDIKFIFKHVHDGLERALLELEDHRAKIHLQKNPVKGQPSTLPPICIHSFDIRRSPRVQGRIVSCEEVACPEAELNVF